MSVLVLPYYRVDDSILTGYSGKGRTQTTLKVFSIILSVYFLKTVQNVWFLDTAVAVIGSPHDSICNDFKSLFNYVHISLYCPLAGTHVMR